jgi:SAM-dependent methyltransferase
LGSRSQGTKSVPEPWFVRYYREWFAEDHEPFDDVTTSAQVDFVEEALDLHARARILDLACGWGRHSRILAKHGYEVVGLDLSEEFLRTGRSSSQSIFAWICGDMRSLPFRAQSFDAVICLWNSFGYFDEVGNEQVLREVSRLLVPEGSFLLDTTNRDFLLSWGVLGQDWVPEGDRIVLRSRQLDPLTGVLHNETLIVDPDGENRSYEMRIRCFTFPELRRMLAAEQLEVTEPVCGSYDLSEPFALDSYQMIVTARKGRCPITSDTAAQADDQSDR